MIYKYPSITRQVGGPTWVRSQKTWPYDGVDRLPVSATTASSSSAQLQPGPYRTVRDHGRVPSALSFEQFSARAARPSIQACAVAKPTRTTAVQCRLSCFFQVGAWSWTGSLFLSFVKPRRGGKFRFRVIGHAFLIKQGYLKISNKIC